MDPLTLALLLGGTALTIGGNTLMGFQKADYQKQLIASELKAMLASDKARREEKARQDVFTNQAYQYLDELQNNISYDATKANQDEATSRFMDVFQERGTLPEGFSFAGAENTTSEVKQAAAKSMAQEAQRAQQQVGARARLASMDEAMQANGLAAQEHAGLLGTLQGTRRGSQAVSNQRQAIPSDQVFMGGTLLAEALAGLGNAATGAAGMTGGPQTNRPYAGGTQWAPTSWYNQSPGQSPPLWSYVF